MGLFWGEGGEVFLHRAKVASESIHLNLENQNDTTPPKPQTNIQQLRYIVMNGDYIFCFCRELKPDAEIGDTTQTSTLGYINGTRFTTATPRHTTPHRTTPIPYAPDFLRSRGPPRG